MAVEKTRLVLACGGTGGHLYPGIAVARAFQRSGQGAEVLFIGTRSGMESKLIPEKGFSFAGVAASGFVGKGVLDRIGSILRVFRGGAEAIFILRRFQANLVIGVGGYASVPVILAAFLLGIPRVLLEPNVRPGLANRLLAPFSSLVIAAFEGTRRRLRSNRIDVLGVPIRPELLSRRERPKKVGQTLLILGGSQGAHSVNSAMIGALPLLQEKKERLSVIHQTGKQDFDKVRRAYRDSGLSARVEPFIEDMAEVYAEADLVIGRSGAGTLAELTALGLSSILIPFPYASGHQEDNAKEIEAAGGAKVLLQRDLTPQRLAEAILKLLDDPAALAAMGEASRRLGRPNAAEQIVAACKGLTKKRDGGR